MPVIRRQLSMRMAALVSAVCTLFTVTLIAWAIKAALNVA